MSTNFTEFCDSEDATITAICEARTEAADGLGDTRAGLNRFFLIFGVSPRPPVATRASRLPFAAAVSQESTLAAVCDIIS
jgi:hypothetical protein